MKYFHGSANLRNITADPDTGTKDLAAGIGVQVKVEFQSGGDAVIYDLNEVEKANPTLTDNNGNYEFGVDDGIYKIIIGTGSQQVTLENVEIAQVSASTVKVYGVDAPAGQTVINVPDAPTGLIVVKDGDTQEQGDILDPKDFTYNSATGNVTFTDTFTGNERIFFIYGTVIPNGSELPSTMILRGYVTYEDFDVDLTGVEPADAKIIAAHNYANANNLPVKQNRGIAYWQNQTITATTPTDLTGLTVRMDSNSGTPDLTYNQPIMFVIPATESPIVLDAADIEELNTTYSDYFRKLSHRLPNEIFGDYNGDMVKIIGTELDVQRGGNPLSFFNKQESVTLSRRGQIEQPIYKGYEGTIDSVTIYPRESSQLLFKCPNLLLEEVASFSFLRVERSNTKVTGLVITEGSTWPSNVREVVQALNVQDFIMQDWDCLAMPLGTTSAGGVYCFTGSHIVRLRANRLRGNGGWGFTGCNFIRSVSFIDNDINRIDCHWGAYDVTCINNRIINFGCLLAGGGTLTMRDNEYHVTGPLPSPFGESIVRAMVEIRPDYGAEWDGDILVDGLTYIIDPAYIEEIGSNSFDVIKMIPSPSNADFGRAMYHGRSVTVKNVIYRMADGTQNNISDTLLNPQILNYGLVNVGAHDQYYPHTITVDNITTTLSTENVKISVLNPPNYMALSTRALTSAPNVKSGDYNMKISISNLNAGRGNYTGSRATRGTTKFNLDWSLATDGTYPAYLTDDQAIRPLIEVTNSNVADMGLSVVGQCNIYNSEVSRLQTRSNSAGPVFGPNEEQMVINCYNSSINLTSSFSGSDSWELPDETYLYNCRLIDLIKRDGSKNLTGSCIRLRGTGNRQVGTTSWGDAVAYFFDGESNLIHISGSSTPINSITPDFIGQEYQNTTSGTWFKAMGSTSADWVPLGGLVRLISNGSPSPALVVDFVGQRYIDTSATPHEEYYAASLTTGDWVRLS